MLIIDRFENDVAVIETGKGLVNIPKSDVPKDAKEGDLLVLTIDNNATAERQQRINGMMNKLFKD